jgi:hypothetical protein
MEPAWRGAVLVAQSEWDEDGHAADLAVALAQRHRTRVVLVGIPAPAPLGLVCSPIALPLSYELVPEEALDRLSRLCHAVAGTTPADVPVQYRVRCGRPERVIEALLEREAFSAVVVHGTWMRRRSLRQAVKRWRALGTNVYAAPETAAPRPSRTIVAH